jgi:hypothetical protein
MGAYSHTDLKLLDPAVGKFMDVDYGNLSQGLILLNILIELRVMNQFMSAMNIGIINDDLAQMRLDMTLDPSSLTPFTATSSS